MCARFALQKNQPFIAFLYTMKGRKFVFAAALSAQTRSKKTRLSILTDLLAKQISRGCFQAPMVLAVNNNTTPSRRDISSSKEQTGNYPYKT